MGIHSEYDGKSKQTTAYTVSINEDIMEFQEYADIC